MTIAFWCVLVAALLPYVALAFVKGLNPQNPRSSVKDLAGQAARAHAAHLNAFEAFPPFAAAVVISHLSKGPSAVANLLALAFLVVRVAHMAFYLADLQPPRSAAFVVGLLIVVALFIQAAWR